VHLAEIRSGIELACVDLAMQRLDDDGIRSIEASLEAERTADVEAFSPVAHDLHVVIADVSGNRALTLMVQVLARLSLLHQRARPGVRAVEPVFREVVTVHERIVEAILSGDAELARTRMRRHLDALLPWLR